MNRFAALVRPGVLPIAVAVLCLRAVGDVAAQLRPLPMAFAQTMPRTVVWAWEEPEDLRGADPAKVGVAYLAETLELEDADAPFRSGITIVPRHEPLAVAPNAAVMAVVRVETQRGFRDSPVLRMRTATELAAVAQRPGVRAVQVDFDATRSEYAFYRAVLVQLRAQMPAGMPLSMTALESWCAGASGESWLTGLPVDEAVPMAFRLGGHATAYGEKKLPPIREPLCRTSVGLSTDESWPGGGAPGTQRVYLFSPQPWRAEQLAAAGAMPAGERPAVLRVRDDAMHARAGINDTGLRPQKDSTDSSFEGHP